MSYVASTDMAGRVYNMSHTTYEDYLPKPIPEDNNEDQNHEKKKKKGILIPLR